MDGSTVLQESVGALNDRRSTRTTIVRTVSGTYAWGAGDVVGPADDGGD